VRTWPAQTVGLLVSSHDYIAKMIARYDFAVEASGRWKCEFVDGHDADAIKDEEIPPKVSKPKSGGAICGMTIV